MLTPVYRIPPEILARIFACCVDLQHRVCEYWPIYRDFHEWLNFTHVCHHWREIAVDTAILWTSISLEMSDACVEEMILRSKTADLSFHFDRKYKTRYATSRQIELLTLSMPRVHTLNFKSDSLYGDDVVPEELLASPAPRMHALTLQLSEYGSVPLTSAFLGNEAPLLRHLSLTGCYPASWPSTLYDNLLSLEITANPWRYVPQNYNDMVNAIRRMPALQKLTLSKCLPPLALATSPPQHSVSLEHLRSCTLDGPFLDIIHFLSHFHLCSEVVLRWLHLKLAMDAVSTQDTLRGLSTLLSYFKSTVEIPLHMLYICQVYGYTREADKGFIINGKGDGGGSITDVGMAFLWRTHEQPPQLEVLSALVKSIALESVKLLDLSVDAGSSHPIVDEAMLCTILQRGALIGEIHTAGQAGTTLVCALSSLENTEPGQCVPLLRRLTFHCADIRGDTADVLRAWLGSRYSTGRPLAFIDFQYNDGVPSDLLDLSPSTEMYQRESSYGY
ncbi:hypothetical protein FA95DRAFT_477744 [Auriscalpium vulgare]|uniref:Uncharacterized protein n=1 Tax=Auriscalpium vulgare TaxID=40419 RepID=A0ACB8SB08_9AGAM|nr:hypothetical protein FA95DRAFT_477744 [Auriscalpium vulgare]